MESEHYEIHSWNTYDEYYKINLDNFEMWTKGLVKFIHYDKIDLFDSKGKFHETQYNNKIKEYFTDVRIDDKRTKKEVIQIDYKFYLVPVSERHSVSQGRLLTFQRLKASGIKGLERCRFAQEIKIEHHYTFAREKYSINRPLEVCFSDEYRYNTFSFINFNHKKYLENYNKFISEHPSFEKEAFQLKRKNEFIILDFYDVNLKILSNDKFDRLKYAIKALNIKINNKIKNK